MERCSDAALVLDPVLAVQSGNGGETWGDLFCGAGIPTAPQSTIPPNLLHVQQFDLWLKINPFGRHLLSLCFTSSALSPAPCTAAMRGSPAGLSHGLFCHLLVHVTLHLLIDGKCSTAFMAGTPHRTIALQLPKEFSYPTRPSSH